VPAYVSAQNNGVSGAHESRRDRLPCDDLAYSGRIYENTVSFSLVDYLGVSGDNPDAGGFSGVFH
jgi:hypothetical protein